MKILSERDAARRWPYYAPRPEPLSKPEPEWDAEPLRCGKINAEWASHVLGVLEALDQPDAWSGTDAEIFAARQGIREFMALMSRACDLPEKDESATTPEALTVTMQGGALIVLEDDSMGQVVTDITLEDGNLYKWFGPCCKQLVGSVADLVVFSSDAVPDVPEPPEGEDVEDVACNKAYLMATIFLQFATDCLEQWNPVGIFPILDYAKQLRDAWRGIIDVSDTSITKLYPLAGLLYADEFVPLVDMNPNMTVARLACVWKASMNSDSYELTRGEYEGMKHGLGNIVNVVDGVFIKTVFDAVNFSNFQRLSARAVDTNGICICAYDPPDTTGATEPLASGYFLGPNLAGTEFEENLAFRTGVHQPELAADVYGVLIQYQIPFEWGTIKRNPYTDYFAGYPVDVSMFDSTSDSLQSEGLPYGVPLVAFADDAIAEELAAQLGFVQIARKTCGGSPPLGTPKATAGQSLGVCLYHSDDEPAPWAICRLIYKIAE